MIDRMPSSGLNSHKKKTTTRPTLPELTIHASSGKSYVAFLKKHLLRATQEVDSKLTELSVALVGDGRMSSLHEQFMDIAGPTDVLTFPLDFDGKGRVTAGEIVICVPEAIRQAKSRKSRVDRELLLYAVHGMLHLCGFDDLTESDFRKMHRMEDDILTRLGLGPVFGLVDSSKTRLKMIHKSPPNANRSSTKRIGTNRARPMKKGFGD